MPKSIVVLTFSLLLGTQTLFAKDIEKDFSHMQIELISKQLQKIKSNRKDYKKMLHFKAKISHSSKKQKKIIATN